MRYYEIKPHKFGELWAYGEVYYNCLNFDHSIKPKVCPMCGRDLEGSKWLGPYNIMVNKKKMGDFIYGVPDLFLCSERFYNAYLQADLKGIDEFTEMNLFYRGKKVEAKYYQISIGYSMKKFAYAKERKEQRKFDKSIPRCPLCMRSGNGAFDNWRELYFDDQIELDIFRIFEKRGRAYCNERFVTFCAENHFTNMVENCYPVNKD